MTFVMFITTLLISLAILVVWHRSVFVALAFALAFGLIDGAFLSATLNKFAHGGWFPVALSGPRAAPPSASPRLWQSLCLLQAAFSCLRMPSLLNLALSPAGLRMQFLDATREQHAYLALLRAGMHEVHPASCVALGAAGAA